MPLTNEARRSGVRDGLGAPGCIWRPRQLDPNLQWSPSVRQAQKRNPLRLREAEWSGGLQRGEGAALPPQWGVCRTWSPRFLACLSPASAPLSPSLPVRVRRAEGGRRKVQRNSAVWMDTHGERSVNRWGTFQPHRCTRLPGSGNVAGIGQRDTAEAGFESCHCFFELSSANARRVDTQRTQGIASVAREFTGTDRPRVNPECRTHGPCRSKTAPDHRAVGFPSRPGGQGHFPGCIPSS
jgi:hypothetical protein